MHFGELDLTRMVKRVLAGENLARAEAGAVLNCPNEQLPELLAATVSVREATFGRRVKICIQRNAQSDICPGGLSLLAVAARAQISRSTS